MEKTLIEAGWVIPKAERAAVIRHGAIAIEGDRIVQVGDAQTVRKNFAPDRIVSMPMAAALPGLINTHTHLVGGFNKAITEDVSGNGLFRRARPLQEEYVNADNMYYPGLVHAVEMLKTGTTTINENWWNQMESAKIVRDLGIRAVLAEMVREVDLSSPRPGSVDRRWNRALAEEGLRRTHELIETWHGFDNGRITCRVGPHAPDMLSEWGFRQLMDISHKHGIGVHMHLAQVPGEAEQVRSARGMSPVEYMNELGVLGPNTIGVHCVFLTDKDIQLMSDTRTAMSHTAYLVGKRGYFPPMEKIYGTGVQVTFGSDWCSNDMWKIMRAAILFARVKAGRSEIMTGYDALRIATLEGAKALGIDKDVGTLEAGKKADLIVVDLANAWMQPIRNDDIITNLVYNANGSDVSHVWVDGQLLVDDHRLTRIDENALFKEAQAAAEGVWEAAADLF
jgi:5-methylthioadenosine/S-adenosylhomocysteine deaminase